MSYEANFTIKELMEAGVHFGHKTMRWNPKMAPFLYGSRDDVHIIDLQQTAPLLHRALIAIYNVVKNNGRVLFVGTKKQASNEIAESAKRCGQYFVNNRWLGGMLTNWPTISKSINTLQNLEKQISNDHNDENYSNKLTKKELLEITRKRDKLELSLGGIRNMGGKPDLLFVIDTNKENLAILEASKLNIPIIAILDSNSNPDNIDYPIPGNDDATRSIKLYCRLVSDAALIGIEHSMTSSGVDFGESENAMITNDRTMKDIKPIKTKKEFASKKNPKMRIDNKSENNISEEK